VQYTSLVISLVICLTAELAEYQLHLNTSTSGILYLAELNVITNLLSKKLCWYSLNVSVCARACTRNGRTNLAAALRSVRTDVFTSSRGARDSAAKVVVVMTTSASFNETETVREAMRLRADGVAIIGVGIGQSVSRSELDGVVSYPVDRNAFYVDDYSNLTRYVSDIVNSQCNGTSLAVTAAELVVFSRYFLYGLTNVNG